MVIIKRDATLSRHSSDTTVGHLQYRMSCEHIHNICQRYKNVHIFTNISGNKYFKYNYIYIYYIISNIGNMHIFSNIMQIRIITHICSNISETFAQYREMTSINFDNVT